jgi:RNA polymerase sporulation-specific sigma factor
MQLGSLGLLKAIKNYNAEFGVMFSTYAVPVIMGEIRRFLRDDGLVHVRRGIRDRAIYLSEAKTRLAQKLGRDPTIQELSEEVNLPSEDIAFALDALDAPRSLDAPAYQEDTVTFGDQLADRNTPDIHERIWLRDAIAGLPQRDRKLIFMRFFNDQSQAQVGHALGISQVQVSRLESRILKKLREG